MASKKFLGEFEQMVLLAVLQRGRGANGYEVRRELEETAGRTVSKGAFYTTLERLERKGYMTWTVRLPEGRGLPQRHFTVTPQGVAELRKSRDALVKLWSGLEEVLGG